ncbi:MAG: hypothetical protein MdMp014T_1916 [Treponematales bacterium]
MFRGEEFEKARKGKGGFALVRGFGKSGRSGAVLTLAGLFIMAMALVFAACGAAEAGGRGEGRRSGGQPAAGLCRPRRGGETNLKDAGGGDLQHHIGRRPA